MRLGLSEMFDMTKEIWMLHLKSTSGGFIIRLRPGVRIGLNLLLLK